MNKGKFLRLGWQVIIIIVVVRGVFEIKSALLRIPYNRLVKEEQNVDSAWSEVEKVYQRRVDLIPNLVATVSGHALNERETLEAVIVSRTQASSVRATPDIWKGQAEFQRFQQAQAELTNALLRLRVGSEQYPDLKANHNFIDLQDQLKENETNIYVARKRFIKTVQAYNAKITQFPNNIFAWWFGFQKKEYLQS